MQKEKSKVLSNRGKTVKMVETAILAAIILVMAFTPLGYLKVGVVSITLLTIPVAIGAVLVGPSAGAILGLIFGLTSFVQCFGMDPFGTMLAGSSTLAAFKMFIVCVITRGLAGWLPGLIKKGLEKVDKTKFFKFLVPCICTPLLNTILFIGTLWLLFRNDPNLATGLLGDSSVHFGIVQLFVTIAGVNALIEIPSVAAVSTAISIPVNKATAKLNK